MPHAASLVTTQYCSTLNTSSSAVTASSSSSTTTPPTTPLLPFYQWSAAKPQTQQLMIVQQPHLQYEETPKMNNQSKRRFSDTTITSTGTASTHSEASSSLSNSMAMDRTESTSSLDCQSLQRSLKRVRLSSSPGELRLQLDLRGLTLGHEWIQAAEDVWHWPRTGCRLEQSQVDPMRLILQIPLSNTNVNCANASEKEGGKGNNSNRTSTRVWIHIPRMYPHRPPNVCRIQHPPGSPHAHITSVRISMDVPDMPGDADNVTSLTATSNESTFVEIGQLPLPRPQNQSNPFAPARTAPSSVLTFPQWTCILRLADVLDFLQASLGGDTLASAPPMPDARGFLAPGRFDMGFYKGDANAMDLKD